MEIQEIHMTLYCKKCNAIVFWKSIYNQIDLNLIHCECNNKKLVPISIELYPCTFEELFENPIFDVKYELLQQFNFEITINYWNKLHKTHPLDEIYELYLANIMT